MLCTKCGKNPAVIFIKNQAAPDQPAQALCFKCARELGGGFIDSALESMGINPEEANELLSNTELSDAMQNMSPEDMQAALSDMPMDDMQIDGEKSPMNMMENFISNMTKFMSSAPKQSPSPQEKSKGDKPEKDVKKRRKFLETYGQDLTRKAKDGQIDRVIGRDTEIARIVQILNRRSKNNPVLLGEPGVGKTAIAEGLALRIVNKQVPPKLFGYSVYLLDFASLVAGTQFRGQFESRLKNLIEEVKKEGNIILVIDEVHNIVGAGDAEGGAMNAANILKPALARGEIQIIGATTITEYRKKIEKDSALERRFQPVLIGEPSPMDTIEIIKGIKDYYESYHKVRISEEVIKAAVLLSERYIHDRFMPDKAIDIIDEASSKVNLANKALIELADLKLELSNIGRQRDEVDPEDFQKIADLKSAECRILDRIRKIELSDIYMDVTVEDVTEVVQLWTNIPVKALTEVDSAKLLNLEEQLHESVVGQDKAVDAIARAVRRKRAGINIKKRPISFIFVGPTGVGKTELVKTLARSMFGSESALIRLDMSEYMEKHSVSKLIGSPPGYVGYDEAGQLTEKIRRNPYSVILLDEIEKAHADVFNIFLQVLDDGRITDAQGRVINFENTVIIMTSNAGSELKTGSMGFESYASIGKYEKALSQLFRPEFLNRVDEIIEFDYLTQEDLIKIAELLLSELAKGLAEKNITMTVSDEAKKLIVEKGYDEKFGARPLRRVVLREIEDVIASKVISGEIKEGRNICIDAANNNFIIL